MRIDYYKGKYSDQVDFINKYKAASNASTGSKFDSNANVQHKNITTMGGEVPKETFIGTNRLLMINKIEELFGVDLAEEYIRQIEVHDLYKHDETSLAPYTYCGTESVVVIDHGVTKLIALEDLYAECSEPEQILDDEKDVCGKYPEDLFIMDRGNPTRITRLVKKARHRDLVVVKTQYGENVIVTDNHPMIVSDDKNDTVEAKNVMNFKQYRVRNQIEFNGTSNDCYDPKGEKIGSYRTHRIENYISHTANSFRMTPEFGYFIGMFIAEGWFAKRNNVYDRVILKMKDVETLRICASSVFDATGCYSTINGPDSRGFCTLVINSRPLVNFMLNELNLGTGAPTKTMPRNIFEHSEDFARGVIAGIIDGDGTVNKSGQVAIRLTSRKCISQLSSIVTALHNSAAMTYQDWSDKEHVIKSRYPMFGISFYASASEYPLCKKLQQYGEYDTRYVANEWVPVHSVETITNESFLSNCSYIYDITTESNTFVLNNLWVHNCVSISMYPFLLNGLKPIGGVSGPPKHLASFCGSFINLVFAVAAQFAGAVSTPEFLTYFDYFARKEWGDDYYMHANRQATIGAHVQTIDEVLEDYFQQVTCSLNQPAAARNYQSVN